MELREVRVDAPEVAPLLAGLADEYRVRYGENDELLTTTADDFAPPAGRFVVLLDDDGDTVAGGGFRPLAPGVCEVKRMWTAPGQRRRGLAATVLAALESLARDAGYDELRLETGPAQPEAEALYTARGYARIPRYGPYESALAFRVDLHAGDGG